MLDSSRAIATKMTIFADEDIPTLHLCGVFYGLFYAVIYVIEFTEATNSGSIYGCKRPYE